MRTRVIARRQRLWTIAIVTIATGLLFGASLSFAADKGGKSATAATAPPTLAQLKANVAKLMSRPTSIGITTPIKGKIPKNKTIAFMRCPAPTCIAYGVLMSDAAKVLGWKVEYINTGSTPASIQAAYDEAIRMRPDAVVGTGNPRAVFENQLQQLKNLKIPFISEAVADPTGNGLIAIYGPKQYLDAGRAVADWVVADSNGKANALFVNAVLYKSVGKEAQGFLSRLKTVCPDCKGRTLDVAQLGPAIPPAVTAALQADRDVRYVVMGFADMALGVSDALKAAGLRDRVKIVIQNISQATIPQVQSGDIVASYPAPSREIFFRIADTLARIFVGQSIKPDLNSPYPNMWFTSANVRTDPMGTPALVANYEKQYKKLWGLAK